MVIGETIDQGFQGAVEDVKSSLDIAQMHELKERQRVAVKRQRDGDKMKRRDGFIVSASKSQLLISPHDDPHFLIDIRSDQMETGEELVWIEESDCPETEGYGVPVATPNQAKDARDRGVELFDILRQAGTGLLSNLTDIILY